MAEIKDLKAREILDSRGTPTIEVDVVLESGIIGRASAPSGASTGMHEAVELRDKETRYGGKGVLKAIHHVHTEIKVALLNHDVRHQKGIDDILIRLDDTPNKSRLGANALMAVSVAAARAASHAVKMPFYQYLNQNQGETKNITLPVPLMNVINGGVHADNNIDVQEYMIVPVGAPSFKEAIRYGVEIFQALKSLLKQKGFHTGVGDEGGFAPQLSSNEAAIELILEAIQIAGFTAGKDIFLALDLASSEFYSEGKYHLAGDNKTFSSETWISHLVKWVNQYPILSLEDGMAEEDWQGWKWLTEALDKRIQLVGDDLFVTNTKMLIRGIQEQIANAILIKPNQIGTLTETFHAIQMAQGAHFSTIISHRSGETEDTLIADLAVASNAGQIKAGSLSRTDRVAKYNQLLRIEEALGNSAQYAGYAPFGHLLSTLTRPSGTLSHKTGGGERRETSWVKKGLLVVLCLMFIVLQYRLWGGESNLLDVYRLRKAIVSEKKGIAELTKRNQTLDAELKFLKLRPEALEERARAELGMIKKNETFCLVVEPAR